MGLGLQALLLLSPLALHLSHSHKDAISSKYTKAYSVFQLNFALVLVFPTLLDSFIERNSLSVFLLAVTLSYLLVASVTVYTSVGLSFLLLVSQLNLHSVNLVTVIVSLEVFFLFTAAAPLLNGFGGLRAESRRLALSVFQWNAPVLLFGVFTLIKVSSIQGSLSLESLKLLDSVTRFYVVVWVLLKVSS